MGLWLKQDDGSLVEVGGGGGGGTGEDGKGWTGGTYDPETGTVTFTSDDGLGFTTGDLRGTDGIDGLDGNIWHVGSGDPDPTLGEDGDYYLDGDAGWVWIKRSSGWTNLYVNLTGPPGPGIEDAPLDGDQYARQDGAWTVVTGGGGDYLPLTGGTVTGDLGVDGQMLASRGSGTAPGLSFADYKGTGFYPGSNNVATHVNGVWQFVVYEDKTRVIRDLQVDGTINGTLAFGIADDIDTRDVLERAEVATMPAVDDEGVTTTDADVESVTVNEVVTALLAKVKEQATEIATLTATVEALTARIETLENQ